MFKQDKIISGFFTKGDLCKEFDEIENAAYERAHQAADKYEWTSMCDRSGMLKAIRSLKHKEHTDDKS